MISIRTRKSGALVRTTLIVTMAASAAVGWLGRSAAGQSGSVHKAQAAVQRGSIAAGVTDLSFAALLEKAVPAVVAIRAKGSQEVEQLAILSNPLFSQLAATDVKDAAPKGFISNGSGVIIDAEKGFIVTNYHVVESANEIKVRLNDGREFEGELIGQDPAVDIAVVRIRAYRLTAAVLGDSPAVKVGDLIFAVGNPLGLDSTATMGMVSNLRRTAVGYRNFEAYIQHDAAVNSGNSGGALLNLKGELIGINTAILSPNGGSIGLGFAVPISYAKRIWDQLIQFGKVHRGHIGIKTTDMTTNLFDTYGLSTTQGAFVLKAAPGSPAEKAGLEFADVVTGVSIFDPIPKRWVNVPIQRTGQLEAAIAGAQVGEEITLQVLRGFDRRDVPIKIADMRIEPERLEVPAEIVRLAGTVVQPLQPDNLVFGKVRGVEVVEVRRGSLAEVVGLQVGDVMIAIDRDRIRNIDDVVELTKDKNQKFDISIMRKGKPLRIVYPL